MITLVGGWILCWKSDKSVYETKYKVPLESNSTENIPT